MSDGKLLVGNYELKNCVFSGATTQIWEVNQPGSPMQLAMKLILDDYRKESAHKNVLKHEFKIGKLMQHPAFLRFHEISINRDHAFFIMDYFRSPSLKTQITSSLTATQSSFPKMAEALAQAYGAMHDAGWLHRDIKPDNILVNKAGEVRIIDFSLSSKVLSGFGKMISGKQKKIQGTRTYIAPETILKKPATPQTDMYSLGVTYYEVLTGHPVFAGDTPNALLKKHLGENPPEPSAYNPNVTKALDAIILKLLEKDPTKRYESMQELANALKGCNCFEEDPLAMKERKAKEAKEAESGALDKRLDSRADADRTSRGITAPKRQKKKKRVDPKLLREEEERKKKEANKQGGAAPAQPAAQAPMMPMPGQMMPGQMPMPGMMPGQMPMPGMMPGQMPMPGQMMPGQMPMPGQMMPGQMPPGQPMMPGQMPPGQMPPGQPMMPGQMPPGQPMPPGQMPPGQMPPQPMPPGQPMPGQPPQPMPQQAAPVPQQPAPAPPPAAPQPPVQQPPAAQQPPAQPPAPAADNTDDMEDLMSQLNIE